MLNNYQDRVLLEITKNDWENYYSPVDHEWKNEELKTIAYNVNAFAIKVVENSENKEKTNNNTQRNHFRRRF